MTASDHFPTDDEVREAFAGYLKGRADAGVLLAKSADVSFADGVVTVVFYPAAVVPDSSALMDLSPFDNHAEFPGTLISFDNEVGKQLRKAVRRVDTFLADGTSLGSLTSAELYRLGTGVDLPPD